MTQICDCFDNIRTRMIAKLEKDLPKGHQELEVEWAGRGFLIGGGDISPVNPELKYSYRVPTKAGMAKNKTRSSNKILASYCCFCGRKLGGTK
jgi:hypothetical protein